MTSTATRTGIVGTADDLVLCRSDAGDGGWSLHGLPPPVPGTIYVVSAMVAARCAGRDDVFAPGTGPQDAAIRDAGGQVYAVTRLIQAAQAEAA